jgi:hypothetical protein
MSDTTRANIWKITAVGLVVAGVTAVVTGLVVANRVVPTPPATEAPSAAPSAVVAAPPAPATTPAPAASTDTPRPAGTPPREVVSACNQQAAAQAGSAPRQGKDKVWDVAKDAGIGALGGAAVGALGGAIADGGSGAGKGALIGGAVGAGGGTLYGIWDNKKHDERFRAAYGSCMKARGYTG